ncbi:MAG: chloride channel protein [Gammaproteobacteria bacterium]
MLRRWYSEDGAIRVAVLAVIVGVAAGFGAVVFRDFIALVHNLAFLGRLSFVYDATKHTLASPLGVWIILVPVAGALVVAFLVSKFAPEAKGHGVPEVMDAMYYKRGIIRPLVGAIKAIASSISIGTGGAVGREGPIIQIGASFGSSLSQWLGLKQWQRMTLISCGAAGGIAATFNTPIGGVLFAVELIMPEISVRTLIPVALATGTATAIGRVFFGDHPSFLIPQLPVISSSVLSPWSIAAYLVFGLALGCVSALFIRSIYAMEDLFNKLPGNYYLRHATGMLAVGIMIYLLVHFTGHYYVEGVSYATVQDILEKTLTNPWLLLLLLAAKLLATSLTLGSGGSGGIFSPALFLGATLGGCYAALLGWLVPGMHADAASLAVVGMAGIIGGSTGAVVTAVVIVYEMTRDYNVILPLLISVSVAYGVRRWFVRGSIYDLKLARRGHYIPESLQTNMYLLDRVRDFLRRAVVRVPVDGDWSRLERYLTRLQRLPHVIIVDGEKVLGIIAADRVLQVDRRRSVREALERQADRKFIVVCADDLLFDVMAQLRNSPASIVIVTANGDLKTPRQIKGVLTWSDIASSSNLPEPLLGARTGRGMNTKDV